MDVKSTITFASINIQGLVASKDKRKNLMNWILMYNIDIICIQEWYIHNKNNIDLNFELNDFINYEIHNPNDKTLILYKSDLEINEIDKSYNIDRQGLDITWISFTSKKTNSIIFISSFYHSPSYESTLEILSNQKSKLSRSYNNYRDKYFIIAGDFNAKHNSWGSSINDNRGNYLYDWMAKNDMKCINNGNATHVNKNKNKYKLDAIDLIIVSDNLNNNINNFRIDKYLYNKFGHSDHFALLCNINLQINIIPETIRKVWNWNDSKDEIFREKLNIKLKKWKILFEKYKNDKFKCEKCIKLFQMIIYNKAESVYGFKYISNKNKFINKKVEKFVKDRHKILCQIANKKKKLNNSIKKYSYNFRKLLNREIKCLKSKRNKLNHKIQKQKEKRIISNTENIEKNINKAIEKNCDKTFHNLYKIAANSKKDEIKLLRDKKSKEIIATSEEAIANKLIIHFNDEPKRNDYNDEAIEIHNGIDLFMQDYKPNHNQNNSVLNREFSEQEIMKRINKLNLDSAMAWDEIHYKLLHIAKYIIVPCLVLIFNAIYIIHQYLPYFWRFSEYIPAVKPGRDADYMDNIRPLQIIPGLLRIFMAALADRILYYCIKNKIMKQNNCAFQVNRSTEDIYLALTEKILRAFENGHFMEIAIMDLKSAYDSVNINILIYKLINLYKMDGNIIAILIFYFNNRFNRVKFKNAKSEWHNALANLPQGDPISPILFCLFLNDFISKVLDTELSNFADDCTLELNPLKYKCKLDNNLKIEMRKKLQKVMNQFYQYTLNNKLILKKIKCNTATFCNKKNFSAYVYKLEKNKLNVLHSYENSPQKCKHNAKYKYLNCNDNDSIDSNGDSDLENLDENNNKININNIKINYKFNTDKNIKKIQQQQQQQFGDLPESLRLLGVNLDPKLLYNKHIEISLNKVNKDIYKLIKIANCKYYRLSAFTIWKLWISTIRPKLEYAISTISQSQQFKIINNTQIRVAKIALRVKNKSKTLFINEILNIKNMYERRDEMLIKMWCKYQCAPHNMLQFKTFKNWKEYLLLNGGNINYNYNLRSNKHNLNENFNINAKLFPFISKSPLSRAYQLIRELTPKDEKIFINRKKQVMKPPPMYDQPFPTNITISNANNFKASNPNNNHINFYSDGSCIPNPGPGASAFYSNNFIVGSKVEPINHDTTINYAELNCIKMIFETYWNFIKYNFKKYNNYKFCNKIIDIYTDSKFVCDILTIDGYPKYDYYYHLINKIINLSNKLNKLNIKINIFKINAHKGILGNEIADKIAKKGAQIAIDMKNNKIRNKKYRNDLEPLVVIISKYINELKLKYKIKRKTEWMKFLTEIKISKQYKSNDCNLFMNSEFLFTKIMFDNNGKFRNKNNKMKNELKYLNPLECEIINKLRTEMINLNNYKYKFHSETNGKCKYCECNENISHFLLNCNGSEVMKFKILEIRKKLFDNIKKIDIFFNNNININSINLLFPHHWQENPNRDDPQYKQKLNINLEKRVKIIKQVCKFVVESERFKYEQWGY